LIEEYTKLILIHHGNHNFLTTQKFVPKFSSKDLNEIILLSSNSCLSELRKILTDDILFDESVDRMLTCKNPEDGDIIKWSSNNFYQGIKLKDLDGFNDKNPDNSTVLIEDGKIVEKIWRAGNKNVREGLYAHELKNIIFHLKEAAKYCGDDQQHSIMLLIKYFEEGNIKDFDNYNISWLKTDPKVDMILGFIESYIDPRSKKCTYESMIFFRDDYTNSIIKGIAEKCQHLEDNAPWNDDYKKKWGSTPVGNAIILFASTGGGGPVCFAGVNLPNNELIREEHGSKSIYLSNTTYVSRNAFLKDILLEFLEKEEDRTLIENYRLARSPIMVTLHEVVGHGSGKASKKLKGEPREYLREHYPALEEARAELCALHHLWDPLIRKVMPDNTEGCCMSGYLWYMIRDMTQMRTYTGNQIHEDHDRATRMIIQYLIEKGGCEYYIHDGKYYPRVISYELMREGVAELLREVTRIKSEGDYEKGKELIERYGIKFDEKIRDQVMDRCKNIYPSQISYIMPEPRIVDDDVILEYPSGIIEQGLRWKEIGRKTS